MKEKTSLIIILHQSVNQFLNLLLFSLSMFVVQPLSVWALPPKEDIPEEVLATEIIIEGNSSLNNQPLTLSEYQTEINQEKQSKYPPDVDSKIKHNIFLLRIFKRGERRYLCPSHVSDLLKTVTVTRNEVNLWDWPGQL